MPIMTRSAMPLTTRPSGAPGTSLAYITIGAIMAVLAGTSYFFYDDTGHRFIGYIRTSFLILGIVLLVIGGVMGLIKGKSKISLIASLAFAIPLILCAINVIRFGYSTWILVVLLIFFCWWRWYWRWW